ncbi:hypothetical protein CC1G_10720 [Coprinopsis cinerea okayama7|uniref:Uncharacterized protein n=1 Tax=Coprinopsis cinerea (strain Okayama-7 / 130 / ATCC MYA-4618 / FGSC 9003) TaxID=240176 RepID=A8NBD9_COPC7|nr:hypothetical protein CC1G_10720 [Coprinopsis cinerea okayama7\|eukprot:XP_001832138.2 hypothetical protein CC1G_10720 [Coprinopsis cinerea okayama7\
MSSVYPPVTPPPGGSSSAPEIPINTSRRGVGRPSFTVAPIPISSSSSFSFHSSSSSSPPASSTHTPSSSFPLRHCRPTTASSQLRQMAHYRSYQGHQLRGSSGPNSSSSSTVSTPGSSFPLRPVPGFGTAAAASEERMKVSTFRGPMGSTTPFSFSFPPSTAPRTVAPTTSSRPASSSCWNKLPREGVHRPSEQGSSDVPATPRAPGRGERGFQTSSLESSSSKASPTRSSFWRDVLGDEDSPVVSTSSSLSHSHSRSHSQTYLQSQPQTSLPSANSSSEHDATHLIRRHPPTSSSIPTSTEKRPLSPTTACTGQSPSEHGPRVRKKRKLAHRSRLPSISRLFTDVLHLNVEGEPVPKWESLESVMDRKGQLPEVVHFKINAKTSIVLQECLVELDEDPPLVNYGHGGSGTGASGNQNKRPSHGSAGIIAPNSAREGQSRAANLKTQSPSRLDSQPGGLKVQHGSVVQQSANSKASNLKAQKKSTKRREPEPEQHEFLTHKQEWFMYHLGEIVRQDAATPNISHRMCEAWLDYLGV